jgi:hypothetical protein
MSPRHTLRKLGLINVALVLLSFSCSRNQPSTDTRAISSSIQPLVIRRAESPTDNEGDNREPELTATPDGKIILSWIERTGEKRYALRSAVFDERGWSKTATVAEGDNWFVNWADFPSVIALGDGSLAAHWLVKSGKDTYAYNVNIAFSKDGGKTWSKPVVPHLDNTQTEHGFVSLAPLKDGRLGTIWLDGRNMAGMKEHDDENKPLPANMTLRYAAIDSNGSISDEAQLDERVCECCQTSAALTNDGIISVYRDRSQGEVRDIYSVRQGASGWTSPKAVHADNWEINGCPVNGPSVAADGANVAVGWFTGVGGRSHVNVSFSADAGATFGSAIQVDDGETQGRVDVVLLPDKSALVCWLAGNAERGFIKVRRVAQDGSLGPPSIIGETDISRSSGFPRMARRGNDVYFAWTVFGKPSHVDVAVADVSAYK